MPITPQSSLSEPPASSSVASSLDWINGVLFGQVAVGLCVLAVAFVGALMLTGRLPLRQGMRVMLGCFVLLGAPLIAAGFMENWEDRSAPAPVAPEVAVESPRSMILMRGLR